MWLYEKELLKVTHHPASSGGHSDCGSGAILFWIYHWSRKTTRSKGHVTPTMGVLHGKAAPCQVWWPQGLWWWRCNDFSLSHDLGRSRDQGVMRLCSLEPLKVSHHPAKFGGFRQCCNGDIKVLVCHMIKRSCNFGGHSGSGAGFHMLSLISTIIASLHHMAYHARIQKILHKGEHWKKYLSVCPTK